MFRNPDLVNSSSRPASARKGLFVGQLKPGTNAARLKGSIPFKLSSVP